MHSKLILQTIQVTNKVKHERSTIVVPVFSNRVVVAVRFHIKHFLHRFCDNSAKTFCFFQNSFVNFKA